PTVSAIPTTVAASPPGYVPPRPVEPPPPFAPFADAKGCSSYDSWPYGIQNRSGYSVRLSDADLKKQLATRSITYLLGELDILPLAGLHASCSAMAQGPTRLARGLAYSKYVNEHVGASHKALIIPACSHSARCMLTSERALPLLFPKD